jgi:uncharacterized protein YegP (UPF0339 family)
MSKRPYKIEMFADKRGKWRYRVVAPNGEITEQSQAYASKSNCKRAVRRQQRKRFLRLEIVE